MPQPTRSCLVSDQSTVLCGGAQDGAYQRSEDHGATWTTSYYSGLVADATDLGRGPVGSGVSGMYFARAGRGVNGLGRSDDDGRTVTILPGSSPSDSVQVLANGHVLLGVGQRSTDRGETWSPCASGLSAPALEGRDGTLYAATYGSLKVSTDECASWTGLDSPPGVSVVGQDGRGRLYAYVAANASIGVNLRTTTASLYVSETGAAPWQPIPVILQFATDKKGRLLAATGGGLYRLETD